MRLLSNFLIAFCIVITSLCSNSLYSQEPNIVLGRPTDTSITFSILNEKNIEYFIEYGISSGIYNNTSKNYISSPGVPDEFDLINLLPNQRYYYRVHYRQIGNQNYLISPEYSFHTQRSLGSTFTFTIEADEHLYDKKGIRSMYEVCLANQAADKPDFMLSLGDTFGDDHDPYGITSPELDKLHKDYRPYLGKITHSIPFYFCLGNHEGETDYYMLKNPGKNLTVWGTLWRKFYFPNPYPNSFYTGNTDNEPYGVGNPENYYAWTWGDALFVVLDVYRDQCDSSDKPKNWDWSLGKPQYDWLRKTLENSTSKYKFVFAHHIRGQGRGGITNAPLFEWGGSEQKGGYTFDKNRPGWGKPIHKLFVDNKVNIFFQGHDHVFAHEQLDGITYQACPMAADSTYEIGKLANADAYLSDTLAGTGHLRVKVSPEGVKVDYVLAYLPADTMGQNKNRSVAFSYTVGSATNKIETHDSFNNASAYPNPADKILSIDIPKTNLSAFSAVLTNSLGQIVYKGTETSINVEYLSQGSYILQYHVDNQTYVQQVIIHH